MTFLFGALTCIIGLSLVILAIYRSLMKEAKIILKIEKENKEGK